MPDLEYQRAQYRKHRDKRLAAKRTEWRDRHDELLERQRAQYAKHKEKRVAYAREYRIQKRDEVNARARERYYENRDEINERRKGYRARHYAKIYARIQKWRAENPEREFLYHAKRLLNEQTGIPFAEIPAELAEAKVEQLKITRWVRDAQAKDAP